MRSILLLAAGLGLGCKAVPDAPKAIDDLTHFFFLEYDSEDTESLHAGVDNLQEWHEDLGDPEGFGGKLTDIGDEHREAIGLKGGADYTWITGVFELVEHPRCSAQDMADIYLANNQMQLFEGNYDEYGRSGQTNFSCFKDGSCDEAHWNTHITTTMVGKDMTSDLYVELRRLRDAEGQSVGILCRSWMPRPAEVGGETDGNTFFDQSYTIEAFVPMGGRNLHLYGLWNSGGLDGLDPEANFWADQYLKGVEDWNDRMDELCDEDRGLWD